MTKLFATIALSVCAAFTVGMSCSRDAPIGSNDPKLVEGANGGSAGQSGQPWGGGVGGYGGSDVESYQFCVEYEEKCGFAPCDPACTDRWPSLMVCVQGFYHACPDCRACWTEQLAKEPASVSCPLAYNYVACPMCPDICQ